MYGAKREIYILKTDPPEIEREREREREREKIREKI
jgi:hypothetical protein